jgi:hypothetical protein
MQRPIVGTQRGHQTQWAAQFAVASELCKRGYEVSFTMGNTAPVADLMVVTRSVKAEPSHRRPSCQFKGIDASQRATVRLIPPRRKRPGFTSDAIAGQNDRADAVRCVEGKTSIAISAYDEA